MFQFQAGLYILITLSYLGRLLISIVFFSFNIFRIFIFSNISILHCVSVIFLVPFIEVCETSLLVFQYVLLIWRLTVLCQFNRDRSISTWSLSFPVSLFTSLFYCYIPHVPSVWSIYRVNFLWCCVLRNAFVILILLCIQELSIEF